jgi:hypothetical protein
MSEHMAKSREVATQLPRLQARLETSAADYGAAPENSFQFGLHALLDGLEARLSGDRTQSEEKP